MGFHVGQRVECVDDSNETTTSRWPKKGFIKKGSIYTIRQTGLSVYGGPGVRLHEVELTSDPGMVGSLTRRPYVDNFYRADRFRPIQERKTDISVFLEMLKPVKEKA